MYLDVLLVVGLQKTGDDKKKEKKKSDGSKRDRVTRSLRECK